MKKKIIVICIIFLLTILVISGCINNETTDKEQFKINKFDISPNRKDWGENAVLSWEVSDADMVVIDNGIGLVEYKGSMIVSPKNSTTYTLTAVKDNMTINSTVFIEVIPHNNGAEYASVAVEGTENQIKVILTSGGDNYGDGYNITNDVKIFVDNVEVSQYDTTKWIVGGQILLGNTDFNLWVEGETCEQGDYLVKVEINETIVFSGTITIEGPGFEDPSIVVEGLDDQIKLVLVSGGENYDGGFNIANDVKIFIYGILVSNYDTSVWKVGGQILLGESEPGTWVEGETCPDGEYIINVIIKDKIVYEGTVIVS